MLRLNLVFIPSSGGSTSESSRCLNCIRRVRGGHELRLMNLFFILRDGVQTSKSRFAHVCVHRHKFTLLELVHVKPQSRADEKVTKPACDRDYRKKIEANYVQDAGLSSVIAQHALLDAKCLRAIRQSE